MLSILFRSPGKRNGADGKSSVENGRALGGITEARIWRFLGQCPKKKGADRVAILSPPRDVQTTPARPHSGTHTMLL